LQQETTSDYQIDLDAIKRAITPRTRAVVTVSPNNPTGAVYPRAALQAVNELCRERGIFHIHDEAYEYFTYGGVEHFSPGSLPGAGGAHDLAVLAVQGLRHGQLARRLHGGAGRPVRGREQDSGHHPDLSAGVRSTRRWRRCRSAATTRAAMSAASMRRGRAILDALSAADVPCDVPTPDGRVLLPRARALVARRDDVSERLIREHRVATIRDRRSPIRARVQVRNFVRRARLGFGD
jgi:hypothetical protein